MLGNRIRQVIYAALTVIGFACTNYYLVQFTLATKGELTLANFLNFDIALFFEQVIANPASSFIGIDITIAALCGILLIVTEGRRLKMRFWGLYHLIDGFKAPCFSTINASVKMVQFQ